LGVHISFVRSIAMDSWPEKQLQLMKNGGNQACNDYLQKHGIGPRTPIKQKYESPVAQLYKEVLKARVEGRPEPTELPKPVPRQSNGGSGAMSSISNTNVDANGMERLPGETDQQYIARQTRLREEAKARMAAKFGGSGGMGGMGSSGGRMQGIGSDSSYNPNSGGYRGGGGGGGGGDLGLDMNSLVSGFGSVLGSAMNTAKSLADEQTVNTIKSTGASFWGGLTSTVSSVAASITNPDDGSDGLADLQRQVAAQKPASSVYSGFGSDQSAFAAKSTFNDTRQMSSSSTGSFGGSAMLQEAQGLPGEDRNGVELLTGESDEQYVVRQTRLRDEARARMAAKFGGGGLSSASAATPPPRSANLGQYPTNTTSSLTPSGSQSAPSSGNALGLGTFSRSKTPPPKKAMNSNDFFSSFGE
jgi:ADP-ribosylation factor GTPase-activating protein 1